MFNQLGVIGCGLMGGSFALALKRAGLVKRVVGYSKSPSTTERAKKLGVIDVAAESALLAVSGSDIVLIAVPVAATETTFKAIRHLVEPGVLVMDVGSTKRDVVDAARRVLRERIASFVPAHPIAGKEVSGIQHADAGAVQRPPGDPDAAAADRPELVQKATDVWSAIGAQVLKMTPENHDAAFAAVSHLPHLLAFAYFSAVVNQPAGRDFLSLAGPGFRDFTRIAASDPEMWRDILVANREEVLKQSQRFRHALDALEHVMRRRQRRRAGRPDPRPSEGRGRLADGAAPRGRHTLTPRPPTRLPPDDRCTTFPFLDLPPLRGAAGTVRLPGSKSISNRVLLLAGLARARRWCTTCSTPTTRGDAATRCARWAASLEDRRATVLRVTAWAGAAVHAGAALPGQRRHGHAAADRGAGGAGGHPGRALRALRACRACTSARSATWSTRCAAGLHGRRPGPARLPAAAPCSGRAGGRLATRSPSACAATCPASS
jgi:prephenate dehydrogenase